MSTPAILTVQLMASTAMAAIAWFVQVVHYPLFSRVGSRGPECPDDAAENRLAVGEYHAENLRRTRPVVLVPMSIEAAASLWIAVAPPAGVPRGAAIVGLALVAIALLSTAFLQVPLHAALRDGAPPPGTVDRLVRTTWIRTVAWTARALLAAWMIHATKVA